MKKILFASVFALMAAVSNVTAQETTATTEATGTSASSTAAGSTIGGIATSTVVTGAVVIGVAAAIISNNRGDGGLVCPQGFQDVNGNCVIICPAGQIPSADGQTCVPVECPAPTVDDGNGNCVPCPEGSSYVDGQCITDPEPPITTDTGTTIDTSVTATR